MIQAPRKRKEVHILRPKQPTAPLQVWAIPANRNTHIPSKFISDCSGWAAVCDEIYD